MELDLIASVIALVAAGTPLGFVASRWLAVRQTTKPPTPAPNALAEGLDTPVQVHDHRHLIELDKGTLDAIELLLVRLLAAQHRQQLTPVEPERRAVMPEEPEVRMRAAVNDTIERGARAIQAAVQAQGTTISLAVARQQAAAMLYATDEPADWAGGVR